MEQHTPKPGILRSRRGVAILLFAIVAIFALIYVATGATAFLRTQNQEKEPVPATAPVAAAER